MPDLIIYGADIYSSRRVAKNFIKKGRKISCFVDKDADKWGQPAYPGGEIVYSLSEAVERYPDNNLFINVRLGLRLVVQDELVFNKRIPVHKIENYEPYEEYKSCHWLEERLSVFSSEIGFCCRSTPFMNRVSIPSTDSAQDDLDRLIALRRDCIEGIKNNDEQSPCYACRKVTQRKNAIDKKVRIFRISMKGCCNFRCIYCPATRNNTHYSSKDSKSVFQSHKRAMHILDECQERTIISPEFTELHFLTGEFTVYPYKSEIYQYFERYRSNVLTNAFLFDDTIHDLLRNDMTRLCVSVDAGTNETFHKIKGVDGFTKVENNLLKYNFDGKRNIELKYIFLPGINDNMLDIVGFIALCRRINPKSVTVNLDEFHKGPILEMTRQAIDEIINKLKVHGIATVTSDNLTYY